MSARPLQKKETFSVSPTPSIPAFLLPPDFGSEGGESPQATGNAATLVGTADLLIYNRPCRIHTNVVLISGFVTDAFSGMCDNNNEKDDERALKGK